MRYVFVEDKQICKEISGDLVVEASIEEFLNQRFEPVGEETYWVFEGTNEKLEVVYKSDKKLLEEMLEWKL
jgi:hypothetical protein